MAILYAIWAYILKIIGPLAEIAQHFHRLVYPVLLASLALFYISLKKRSEAMDKGQTIVLDDKYRKKMYRINRQVIFLLLLHFAFLNPFGSTIPQDFCTVIQVALDTLLLIPLLGYFFILPDAKKIDSHLTP